MPPGGCPPGLLCADADSGLPIVVGFGAVPLGHSLPAPWATRSEFIIPDDKAYCPEEFKAPNNWLLKSRKVAIVYFLKQPASLLPSPSFLLPFSLPTTTPLLSLFSLTPFPLFSSFLSLLDPIPFPLSHHSSLSLSLFFSLESPRQLCRKQYEIPELDAKGFLGTGTCEPFLSILP